MKLASIVPMLNVNKTFDNSYAMLLSHLSDYYPKNYKFDWCYKIMDNSLIELGESCSLDNLLVNARKNKVNEIILPDAFLDGKATLIKLKEAIQYLKDINAIKEFNLMAVCHGKDVEEFEQCFNELEKIPEIHCIGIPKVATTLHENGRPGFEYLWQNTNKQIHLLGCWESLDEIFQYKNPDKIRSIDTCLPALLSQTTDNPFNVKRPTKTIDLLKDEINFSNYKKIMTELSKYNLL